MRTTALFFQPRSLSRNQHRDRILGILVALACLWLPVSSLAQSRVRVEGDETSTTVSIESEDAARAAATVIERSLLGVGKMMAEMSGRETSPAQGIDYDTDAGTYSMVDGAGLRIDYDVETGHYSISGEAAAEVAGSLIEGSLRGIGKMVRAMAGRGSGATGITYGLDGSDRQAMVQTWQRLGWSRGEIDRGMSTLELADVQLRQAMREVDRAMTEVDDAMARVDEMLGTGSAAPIERSTVGHVAGSSRRIAHGDVLVLDDLEPHLPIHCRGSRSIELSGRRIETEGDAIVLQGNCDLVLLESYVSAGGYAIRVEGNGTVRLIGSRIVGRRGTARLLGNAELSMVDSIFRGPRPRAAGAARLHDQGGNTFEPWR